MSHTLDLLITNAADITVTDINVTDNVTANTEDGMFEFYIRNYARMMPVYNMYMGAFERKISVGRSQLVLMNQSLGRMDDIKALRFDQQPSIKTELLNKRIEPSQHSKEPRQSIITLLSSEFDCGGKLFSLVPTASKIDPSSFLFTLICSRDNTQSVGMAIACCRIDPMKRFFPPFMPSLFRTSKDSKDLVRYGNVYIAIFVIFGFYIFRPYGKRTVGGQNGFR